MKLKIHHAKLFLILFLFSISTSINAQNIREALVSVDNLIQEKLFNEAQSVVDSILVVMDRQTNDSDYLLATAKLIEIHSKKGAYSEGVQVGEDFINQNPGFTKSDPNILSEFYLRLGIAYHLTQSNESKGTSYLNQAKSLFEKSGRTDKIFESTLLRWLAGSYYYRGKYEQSIETSKRRIKLLDPAHEKTELALAYRSIGNSYWGMRDYNLAAEYYDRGLEVLFSDNPVDSITIGKVLHAKGYIYMDQEDYQRAYETFKQASELLELGNPPVSSPMVWIYGDVGRSLIDLNEYDEALLWLQKALNANVYEYSQEDYYQNPPLVNINDDFQHFMILKLKGQAFLGKYQKDKNDADLAGMIDCYLLADRQVDAIRATLPKAEDQSTITYYATELNSKAIKSLAEAYKIKPDNQFLELAHYFMEKQKITAVHLKFLEASAKANNLLPKEMLKRDQEMLNEIIGLKTDLMKKMASGNDSIEIIKKSLFDSQEAYENFISEVKRNYPSYHSSRFNLEVSSLSDVQNMLRRDHPNRAIVTYFNFKSQLFKSILTKDTFLIHVNNHQIDLDYKVEGFRNYLTNPDLQLNPGDTLSQLLIEDLAEELSKTSEITFILDPSLQLIPMELLNLNGKFLFETHDISYQFSATMFVRRNGNDAKSSNFAGFAPSFDSLNLATLPGAELEVTNISKVLEGTTYIGPKATESELKNVMASSGLLHLATHAQINDTEPESSFLQLSSTSNNEDGKLHFFEIYGLNIDAQLVTLSACNTGFGKIQRGEGVMSLSRAFAYAGVPSTVVSLWPASDKSTPQLMEYFYKNLKEGQSKDVALNNARKEYLSSAKGKARHPFYWGGFVLIGDNSPIENDRNLLVYVIPSVLVIVMILTVYRRKKNNQS